MSWNNDNGKRLDGWTWEQENKAKRQYQTSEELPLAPLAASNWYGAVTAAICSTIAGFMIYWIFL